MNFQENLSNGVELKARANLFPHGKIFPNYFPTATKSNFLGNVYILPEMKCHAKGPTSTATQNLNEIFL